MMSSFPKSMLFLLLQLPGTAWRLARRGRLLHALAYMLHTIWHDGPSTARSKLRLHLAQNVAFARWVARYDTLDTLSRHRLKVKLDSLKHKPLISLLMPVYNCPEQWLREAIKSIQDQIYGNWELCIVDDSSTEKHVRPLLEQLSEDDPRIHVLFRSANGHISAATNDALAIAQGDFVGLVDHDDLLPPHALAIVALEISRNPEVDLLYSDHDKIDLNGRRFDPYFKPDWNPDLLRSQNMISHFGVYRAALVKAVGGFRVGFEGSQDWDLALRVSEATASSRIRHLPYILYHWRTVPGSTATGVNAKSYAVEAGRRAVTEHLERQGLTATVLHHFNGQFRVRYALPTPLPKVSFVVSINTPDDALALKQHLPAWLLRAGLPIHEVLVSSKEEFSPLISKQVEIIQVSCERSPGRRFHAAADRATGDVLVFLSPQLSASEGEDGWLAELISHALRSGTGAVGAQLLSKNKTLVGGGYILGIDGSAGSHHGNIRINTSSYMAWAALQQNLSAIHSDCLVVRRSHYLAAGGLDSDTFPEQWYDVDFCLRLRQKGLWNVWTPHATLVYNRVPNPIRQVLPEDEALKVRWRKWLEADPAYNPNLSLNWSIPIPEQPRHSLPWREDARP